MLTILVKIFKALNSEQSPRQLAIAASLAVIVGLTPLFSLHNIIIFLLVLWFRVNLTIFLVLWPLFSLFGMMLAPVAENLGLKILQTSALVPLWEAFYNTLPGRWSNFYYSGVIGSLVIAIGIALIIYPVSKNMVILYRDKWFEKFEQYQVVKMLKASKFWQLYQAN